MTSTSTTLSNCKNCGHSFTYEFCNVCGQKDAHRLTVPHVSHEIVHVFLHADKGVFAFVKRIVFEPGVMAKEYLQGKRKIFNPFQYVLFTVGITIFLMNKLHFYEQLESFNQNQVSRLPAFAKVAMGDYNSFMKRYTNIVTFLSIPIYAFSSWIFNKHRQQNYAEHFTIFIFVMCQSNTFTILALLAMLLFNVSNMGFSLVAILFMIVSLTMVYRQFYKNSLIKSMGNALLVYLVAYIVQVMVMGFGMLLYIIYCYINR